MRDQLAKKAGEVAVNSLEFMSEFERKSIQILRHAGELYNKNDFSELPESIKELFSNRFSNFLIKELISIFATYHLRPIVRHQPKCLCVGADENVFAHILRFSLESQENEVKILSSLLISSSQIENLTKKAKVVAFLIDEDIKEQAPKPILAQTFNNNLH